MQTDLPFLFRPLERKEAKERLRQQILGLEGRQAIIFKRTNTREVPLPTTEEITEMIEVDMVLVGFRKQFNLL